MVPEKQQREITDGLRSSAEVCAYMGRMADTLIRKVHSWQPCHFHYWALSTVPSTLHVLTQLILISME